MQIAAQWIPFSGGHDHGGDLNSAPTPNNMGTFQLTGRNQKFKGRIMTQTNRQGTVLFNYSTPEFGGKVELVATTTLDGKQLTARDTLLVKVPDFTLLPESPNYKKIGGTCNHHGPRLDKRHEGCKDTDNNHWAHPTVATWLDSIAVRYHRQYPDGELIRYNDISLPNGGGFDINARWNVNIAHERTGHQYHRFGKSVDIRTNPPRGDGIPLTRLQEFQRFVRRLNPGADVEEHGNPGQEHFHIDFDL
jgi:hypothetical protein